MSGPDTFKWDEMVMKQPGEPIHHSLMEMLAMRMRWVPTLGALPPHGFSWIELHENKTTNMVYLAVQVGNNPPLIIEDGSDLFPSDGLITKLKLLRK